MKVYRYLSQDELNKILSNNISLIGTDYSANEKYSRVNNHRYKSGTKYLHFFKHKDDCKRVEFINEGKDIDFYIAEFDIPITTLIQYIGYGKYDKLNHNGNVEKVIEFAIPTSKFKPKYIRSYVRDEIHHRSLEKSKNLDEMLLRCKNIFKKPNSIKTQLQLESQNLNTTPDI